MPCFANLETRSSGKTGSTAKAQHVNTLVLMREFTGSSFLKLIGSYSFYHRIMQARIEL